MSLWKDLALKELGLDAPEDRAALNTVLDDLMHLFATVHAVDPRISRVVSLGSQLLQKAAEHLKS